MILAQADKPLSSQDDQLAELIFRGTGTAEIARETGLCDREIRYVLRGERRAHVASRVSELVREFKDRERSRLMQARSAALDALVEGLQANRPVTVADAALIVPDHAARVRAAVAIRHEPVEEESTDFGGVDRLDMCRIVLEKHNKDRLERERERERERAARADQAREQDVARLPGAAPLLPGAVRQ